MKYGFESLERVPFVGLTIHIKLIFNKGRVGVWEGLCWGDRDMDIRLYLSIFWFIWLRECLKTECKKIPTVFQEKRSIFFFLLHSSDF